MENVEIRMTMLKNNIKFWQVANVIGVNPDTFSRWMRYELTGERLERVQKALDELRVDKEAGESV